MKDMQNSKIMMLPKLSNNDMDNIANPILEKLLCTIEEVRSKTKLKTVTDVRCIIVYNLREACYKQREIGEYLNADPRSVRYLLNRYNDYKKFDPDFQKILKKLTLNHNS